MYELYYLYRYEPMVTPFSGITFVNNSYRRYIELSVENSKTKTFRNDLKQE